MVDKPQHRVAREELSRPGILVVYILAPLAAVAVWLLGRAGLVHRWSFLVVAGSILGAVVVSGVAAIPWLRDRTSTAKLQLKIAAQAAAVATVIFMTGWGSMLVIVFMIVAHENVNLAGSSSWKAVLGWCSAGLLAGQIAIQVGWAPSMVEVSRSWSVAVLAEMGLIATVRQLSLLAADKEKAERAVADAERRFRILVNNASDIILLVDAQSTVVQASPAVERQLGIWTFELEGTSLLDLLHPEDVAGVAAVLEKSRASPGELFEAECRILSKEPTRDRGRRGPRARAGEATPEPEWRWMEATVVNLLAEPAANGLVVTLHDVTERRHQALHDALTGLPNRVLLKDLGNRYVESARGSDNRCGLLLMDLDRFKEVNDTYGHHYGDELLMQVGGRLERAVREPDTVVRLGGDEFAVLLPDIDDAATAVQVSHRVIQTMAAPFRVIDVTITIGMSIGIALFPDNGDSLSELMMKADAAMYEAKRGRTGYMIAA